jgi:hypothetical protein
MKKRHTIQCTLVLEALNKLQYHVTADEIYNEIVKEHPNISKAICRDYVKWVKYEKGRFPAVLTVSILYAAIIIM